MANEPHFSERILIKEKAPSGNPPAGYLYVYAESGVMKQKDSSGTVSNFVGAPTTLVGTPCEFILICSAKDVDLVADTKVAWFPAPYPFLFTSCSAELDEAGTGSTVIFDINNGANSMLSTKLSIDASETTSSTAATPPVINTTYDDVAAGAIVSVDIDQPGSSTPGKEAIVVIKGTRTA